MCRRGYVFLRRLGNEEMRIREIYGGMAQEKSMADVTVAFRELRVYDGK